MPMTKMTTLLFATTLLAGMPLAMARADEAPSCSATTISTPVIAACDALIADAANAVDKPVNLAFRGHALMVLGKPEAALSDFAEALKAGPFEWRFTNGDVPDPAYWSAMIEIGRNQPAKAIAALDLRLQRAPNDVRALVARAQALELAGNADWALAALNTAVTTAGASTDMARTEPWNRAPTLETLEAEQARLAGLVAASHKQAMAGLTPANLLLATALADGKVAKAVSELDALVAQNPDNQQAQFALGIARFMVAVEHLGQALNRHGLKKTDMPLLDSMMFLRMPVPANDKPETLTYAEARAILDTFRKEIAFAAGPLSKVSDPDVRLDLDLASITLDLNANGQPDAGEELALLYQAVSGAQLGAGQSAGFRLKLDAADATWLEGYSHLLGSLSDILLGYDWHQLFDATFFRFFPDSGVPNAELANRSGPGTSGFDEAEIVDLIAFIHTLNWPVAEPARLANARKELLEVVRLSRENWRRIQAETDDDHEWVPGPKQTGALAGMAVSADVVTGWLAFLDSFEAMLNGQLLIPHWRYDEGLNLKKLFDQPTTLDVVMWIQGPALKPYLEAGRTGNPDDWNRIMGLMNGDIFRYALWFN